MSRSKRILSAEQKYDLWVRMLCGGLTMADAAAEANVDRTTIARIKQVARDGAIAALRASKPGRPQPIKPDAELVKLRSEVARLEEVIVDQAIELAALRGKVSWA
jgi:hypothetical protein